MHSHAPTIAKWFHVSVAEQAAPVLPAVPLPGPGAILLLTGPSGSGKSTLLRRLHDDAARNNHLIIDLADVRLPDRPTIDVPSLPLADALRLLSLVGLAEAHTYLLPPRALSDGQRWRLRLAVALARARASRRRGAPVLVLADEFGALLDRVTALTLCRAARRLTREPEHAHLSFALATSHADLIPSLAPDTVVRCDFGSFTIEST